MNVDYNPQCSVRVRFSLSVIICTIPMCVCACVGNGYKWLRGHSEWLLAQALATGGGNSHLFLLAFYTLSPYNATNERIWVEFHTPLTWNCCPMELYGTILCSIACPRTHYKGSGMSQALIMEVYC